jgi:predicted transposase YdaD
MGGRRTEKRPAKRPGRGPEEGREEGREEGQRKMIEKLLAKGVLSVSEIASALEVDLRWVEQIRKALEEGR